MISSQQRPFLVQDRNIKRSFFYAALAGLGLTAGILADFAPVIGICLGGLVVALLFLFILVLQRRNLRRILDPMVEGDRFVHWTYTAEEWQRHMAGEGKRVTHYLRRYLLLGLITGTLLGLLIFSLELWGEKESLATSMGRGSAGLLALFSLFLIIGLFHEFFLAKRLRELKRIGGEVYIGREGLYYSGDLYPRFFYRKIEWKGKGDNPLLLFTFEIPVKNRITETVEVLIPVPARRQAEAQEAFGKIQAAWNY